MIRFTQIFPFGQRCSGGQKETVTPCEEVRPVENKIERPHKSWISILLDDMEDGSENSSLT